MKRLITTFCLALSLFLGTTVKSFALPPCPSYETWNNCFGAWSWESGNEYIGEWTNDKLHGQGTFTYANGDKYVGEFKDDLFHGQGVFTFGSSIQWAGDKYVGEWMNGVQHGQGTYTYADGFVQKGIWENGEFLSAEKLTDQLSVAFKRRTKKERKAIQRRLAELGLYHSTIDGLFGKRTRAGINSYATSQNLADITTPEGARSVIEKLVTLSNIDRCAGFPLAHVS